jgi:hypothetical protein
MDVYRYSVHRGTRRSSITTEGQAHSAAREYPDAGEVLDLQQWA